MDKKLVAELIDTAMSMGAKRAETFTMEQIVFDQRVLLKCFFGCPGGMPYCPKPEDANNSLVYSELIKKYEWGIIIDSDNLKKGQRITLALESKAFLAGKTFAFGATECENCESCAFSEGRPCAAPRVVRPPLYALGIDVYKTVNDMGWELKVVQQKGDPARNITAVFVE